MATLPNNNVLVNNIVGNYQYYVDPSTTVATIGTNISNNVTTTINMAYANITKYVDKSAATIGNQLNYTMVVNNIGNTTANNVVLLDTIPNGTSFIANSIQVNGVSIPSAVIYPPSGLNLGNIIPSQIVTVTWSAIVTTVPNINPIPNSGVSSFYYVVDPILGTTVPSGNISNQVLTEINYVSIDNLGLGGNGFNKTATPGYVAIGDIISYTLRLTNTGNTTATNLVVTDTIPVGTTFIDNSVTINGATMTGVTPESPGIAIGTLPAGQTVTVTFNVQVGLTLPNPNPILNSATNTYNFTIDPEAPDGGSGGGNSNSAGVKVNSAIINNTTGGGFDKYVSKDFASINDILTYTLIIGNTGNQTATNVVVVDTIPEGTIFVLNSILVDGIQNPSINPGNGVLINNIAPGAVSTMTFNVQVTATIPSPNLLLNSSMIGYNFTVVPTIPNARGGQGESNSVVSEINSAIIDFTNGGGATKVGNPSYADINDIITYTITLKNTGNVSADNVVITDTIPTGTTFVPNSIFINSVQQFGATITPPTGLNVGSILPGETTTVLFNVIVNSLPSPNQIINYATTNYTYTENPRNPDGVAGSGNTNGASIQINNGSLNPDLGGFSKTVSELFAAIGDVLTYTINFKNTGNVTINNVIIKDTIPTGTVFENNSVYINGNQQVGVNPESGIDVGTVPAGTSGVISFEVTVYTIPSPNPIENNAVANYSYIVSPTIPGGRTGANITNNVFTQVNQAIIDFNNGGGLVKSVDKQYAVLDDVLNYTFVVINTGNTTANNVVIIDTVPSGTSYVTGSAKVNGNTVTIPNPSSGIPVGTVAVNTPTTVTFQALVTTIPSPNPMPNSGFVSYSFIVDPINQISTTENGTSNTVTTQVNQAIIDNIIGGGFVKYTNKNYANIGDVITYTIAAKNTGTTTADNVLITDTIPYGIILNPASIFVNGVTIVGNPSSGINIGNIAAGSTSTLIFSVTVLTIPTINPILNAANTSYLYTVTPENIDGAIGYGNTNIVTTQINSAGFNPSQGGITKYVDNNYAQIGDTLVYTTVLKNTGNIVTNNVLFIDTIPTGTLFTSNSVYVNGTPQLTANPQIGILLGSLAPAIITTVQFAVTVTTIPSINPIPNISNVTFDYIVDPNNPVAIKGSDVGNIVLTQVNDPNINVGNGGFTKTSNAQYATLGQTITYTILVKNQGNTTADNVIVQDTIPVGTSFVGGSVVINNVAQPSANPENSVNVGSVAPGGVTTMTFNVLVITIPLVNPIPNTANLQYDFTKDPSIPNGARSTATSNSTSSTINAAIIDNAFGGGLNKTVNYDYADIGYILNYTINIANTGNVTAQNIIITDTIPNDVTFVANSVLLNGIVQTLANPQSGVWVGTLPPGRTAVVSFKVNVTTIPSPNPIENSAVSTYSYQVNPTSPELTTTNGLSNTVSTQVNNGTINYNNGTGFVKTVNPLFAQIGSLLTYTLGLTNTGNTTVTNVLLIDTVPNGTSYVPGSATVNGIPVIITSPTNGIQVGNIAAGQTSTVVFSVTVDTIPSGNQIQNRASASYFYTVTPSTPNGVRAVGNSNGVVTTFSQAIIDNASGGFSKSSSPAYSDIGTVITYSILAQNTGSISANNIIVTDTIPNGTTFVAGSVTINGVTDTVANPSSGIDIGTLGPNQSSSITFQIVVDTIPTVNPIQNSATNTFTYIVDPQNPVPSNGGGNTNSTSSQVNHGEISNLSGGFIKSANLPCAGINDVITYTIVVKNTGNVATNNVVIVDTIPNATNFIANTVKVNGVTFSGVNPQSGININSVAPNETVTITFNVLVNSLPASAETSNVAQVNYFYTVSPTMPNAINVTNISNSISTALNSAIIAQDGFIKSVDKAFADLGDILTYTLLLTNSGNAQATNVIVYDTIPNGTSFVPGSIIIDGIPDTTDTPQTGISVGTILVGSTTTISYQVKVNNIVIPIPNPLPNNADVVYDFETCPLTLRQIRISSTNM